VLTEPAGLAAWLAVRSEARCCAATFLDCLGVSCAPAGKTALHRAAIDKAMLTKVRAHVFCIAKPGGCEALDLQAKYKAPIWALGLSLGVIAGAALSSRRREDNKPLEMNLDSGRAVEDSKATGVRPGEIGMQEPIVRRTGTAAFVPTVRCTDDELQGLTPLRRSPRSRRTLDWIVTASVLVLALTATYFTARTVSYQKSQYALMEGMNDKFSAAGESLRFEQRPWVGLSRPAVSALSQTGGGFVIHLKNSGRTPALNVLITDYVMIESLADLTGVQEPNSSHPLAAGTLLPDENFETNIWFKTSPEGVAGLAQGQVRAVNYAWITYEDIFHQRHTTQSCFYWHGGMQAPSPCERFNTVE